ncbi:MAG: hypothetical protein ACRC10_02050 [Thermoguttaceae bacterium]
MQKNDHFFVHFLRSAVLLAFLIAIPLLALFLKPATGLDQHFLTSFKESVSSFFGKTKSEPSVEREPLRRPTVNEQIPSETQGSLTTGSSTTDSSQKETSLEPEINIEQISAKSVQSNRITTTPYHRQTPPTVANVFPDQTEVPPIPISPDFARLENFLRNQSGAVSTRIEHWGAQGKLYRYSCYVATNNSVHGVQKHFQAIASDPMQALQRVAQEIQIWQSANDDTLNQWNRQF